MNENIKYHTKFDAYKKLDDLVQINILIAANNESVYYKFPGMRGLSKRCKLYVANNGRVYFIARRKNYYLDEFTFIPKINNYE